MTVDNTLEKPESYRLRVSENLIEISGKDPAGVFYAVQTLKQMLMHGNLTLTQAEIYDFPAFSYRGFMLDCGRYFYTKEAVFLFLEIMALHKLNTFHWHLTDDQGWRIESRVHYLLAEIGSYRSHTNFNQFPHSGYYTREDMKEIVEYAHSLHIRVIPEISTPGHTVSAIAAYPHLSCFDRELVVETRWGTKYDVLCVGKESTFEFMFSLLDELAEIFTDGIFHLGGDEAPTERWSLCPHCTERMKQEKLHSHSELQNYFLNRIAAYLENKGIRTMIRSAKTANYKLSPHIIRQFCEEDDNTSEIIREDTPLINSCSAAYYLDRPYGQTSLKDTYNYNPLIQAVDQDSLRGIEACLWSEFVPSMQRAGYQTFPRLGAFSETAWSGEKTKNYHSFLSRLKGYYKYLDALGLSYASSSRANPKLTGRLSSILYQKKQKLYQGSLYNLIDNRKVKKEAEKKEQKND